jgi:hypothetical protein
MSIDYRSNVTGLILILTLASACGGPQAPAKQPEGKIIRSISDVNIYLLTNLSGDPLQRIVDVLPTAFCRIDSRSEAGENKVVNATCGTQNDGVFTKPVMFTNGGVGKPLSMVCPIETDPKALSVNAQADICENLFLKLITLATAVG